MKTFIKGNDTFSINPFLPSHEYIPDGEPRIFGGRVYIYGSHDLVETKTFCAGDYVTWSAPLDNLVDWRYEGVIYKRMQDPFVRKMVEYGKKGMMQTHLFAPDIIEIDDKYYMYYGIGLSKSGFGVAVSDSPVGPFEYVGRVRYPETEKPKSWNDGKDGIDDGDMALGRGKNPFLNMAHYPYDPAVLYDNGRLFLYFGLSFCRVVELDINDKRTVIRNKETGRFETDVLVPSLLALGTRSKLKAAGGMGMANGPSIRKIGEIYCLSYYATGSSHCNAMCHATSKSPFGPFEYKGILVSLGNSRYKGQKTPSNYTGNTHGGLVKINDTWYTIYHRHTNNSMGGRQAMVTALNQRSDGSFDQSEHHSMGFNTSALPAYFQWPAYMACYLTNARGKAKTKTDSPYIIQKEAEFGEIDDHSGKRVFQVVTNITDGSVVGYKYFDFGAEIRQNNQILLTLNPENSGYVETFMDNPNTDQCIAKVEVKSTNNVWTDFTVQLKPITGVHSIYFVFHSEGKTLGDFSHFAFV